VTGTVESAGMTMYDGVGRRGAWIAEEAPAAELGLEEHGRRRKRQPEDGRRRRRYPIASPRCLGTVAKERGWGQGIIRIRKTHETKLYKEGQ
jgi:hypothetical protein